MRTKTHRSNVTINVFDDDRRGSTGGLGKFSISCSGNTIEEAFAQAANMLKEIYESGAGSEGDGPSGGDEGSDVKPPNCT